MYIFKYKFLYLGIGNKCQQMEIHMVGLSEESKCLEMLRTATEG